MLPPTSIVNSRKRQTLSWVHALKSLTLNPSDSRKASAQMCEVCMLLFNAHCTHPHQNISI